MKSFLRMMSMISSKSVTKAQTSVQCCPRHYALYIIKLHIPTHLFSLLSPFHNFTISFLRWHLWSLQSIGAWRVKQLIALHLDPVTNAISQIKLIVKIPAFQGSHISPKQMNLGGCCKQRLTSPLVLQFHFVDLRGYVDLCMYFLVSI